jgi:hypothetical protein
VSDESQAAPPRAERNRYNLQELSGAFGDLGTLVSFPVARLAIVTMDPGGVLPGFGVAVVFAILAYHASKRGWLGP